MSPRKRNTTKSPRSTPRAKRSSRKSASTPARLKLLAGGLIVLLVVLVITVKFFQTPRGRVVLLDRGFDSYYAEVQDETSAALRDGLDRFGLRRRISESAEFSRIDGKTIRYLVWDIPCHESTNFIRLNVALTRAVESVGARVRRSEEKDGGRTLVVRVGSGRFDTHRMTIHKTPSRARADAERRPKLGLVIDDFGYTANGVAESILTLDLPVTISILPALPHSLEILARAKQLGRCTLLHLPMEAEEDVAVDIEPVTTSMGDRAIAAMVTRYLNGLAGVDGVNNHQGSRATADRRVMKAVLSAVAARHLFFLDSLTSPKSLAYNTARDVGVPAARNDVFLDDDTEDSEVVGERLRALVERARRNGSAIGIAHPHRWTLDALIANEAYLKNSGVELVYVSELVE